MQDKNTRPVIRSPMFYFNFFRTFILHFNRSVLSSFFIWIDYSMWTISRKKLIHKIFENEQKMVEFKLVRQKLFRNAHVVICFGCSNLIRNSRDEMNQILSSEIRNIIHHFLFSVKLYAFSLTSFFQKGEKWNKNHFSVKLDAWKFIKRFDCLLFCFSIHFN